MTGLFAVLAYVIEKYDNELEIDIINAIRVSRRSGSEFINSAVSIEYENYVCTT